MCDSRDSPSKLRGGRHVLEKPNLEETSLEEASLDKASLDKAGFEEAAIEQAVLEEAFQKTTKLPLSGLSVGPRPHRA